MPTGSAGAHIKGIDMTNPSETTVRELSLDDLARVSGAAAQALAKRPPWAVGPDFAGVRGIIGPDVAGVRGIIGPEI